MNELLKKSILKDIEVKEAGQDGKMHIKAYACVFGNVDSWGDIIEPTACDEFLKGENAERLRSLCWQHSMSEVIGVITDKGVDAIGMWIEADIIDTEAGKDVMKLIKAGAIKELSIGYYADAYRYEKREGYDYEIRILSAITVAEVSLVTRAANPKAILLDAKSEDFKKHLSALSDADLCAVKEAVGKEYAKRIINKLSS